MTTRFAITGAQGFVGRYLVADLIASRPEAVVLGIGRSPELRQTFAHAIQWAGARLPAPLPPGLVDTLSGERYRYASIDVTAHAQLTRALRAFRPDVVVHLASGLRGDPPAHLRRTNVDGTATLVRAMAEASLERRRLVVCSTGGVYGTCSERRLPFDEAAPCRPADPYSRSKLAAEEVSRALGERYGIATVWARLFNAIGAGEQDRHVGPALARQAAEIVHGLRPPVIEVGELGATRDFIDVRDVAHALVTLAESGVAGATYNVGTGKESSIAALLDMVLHAAGLQGAVDIRSRSGAPLAVRRHCGNIQRLRALGFQPRVDLLDSARDLVRYYTTIVPQQGPVLAPESRA